MTMEMLDLELIISEQLSESEDDNCVVCWECTLPKCVPGQLAEALCGRVDTFKDDGVFSEEMCPDCWDVKRCKKCGAWQHHEE